jgi:hypothetical protein
MTNKDVELTELWNAGMGLRDMEYKLAMSESVIRRRARKIGLEPRNKPNIYTAEEKELALSMHAEGKSVRAIGRELGRPHQSITNWLKKLRGPAPLTPDARKSPAIPQESPAVCVSHAPAGSHAEKWRTLSGWTSGHDDRHITKTRQVEWLNRSRIQRLPLSDGPPPSRCQFPSGEKPYVFCAAPIEAGRPYCEEHTSRCYEKTKPIKIVPARAKEQPHYHDWGKW